MADFLSLDDVRAMAQGPTESAGPSFVSLEDVAKQKTQADRKAFTDFVNKRETTDLAYGVRRGLRDALDTGAEGLAWLYDKATGGDEANLSSLVTGQKPGEYARVKRMNDAAREEATAGRPTTAGSVLGYVGGNALATTPILRGMQGAVSTVPALRAFGNSLMSGGMNTGRALPAGAGFIPRAGDMATRMAGGAVNGFVSGGLADPDLAGTSAAIGAGLPPALQAVRAGARGMGQVASAIRPAPGVSGADVKAAREIAEMAGADPRNVEQLAAIRDQLRQQGPSIIPGQLSVPEILQHPGVSQLQRSVAAVQPAPFVERAAERAGARRDVLERIAPIGPRQEVAQEVGNNIAEWAIPAHQQAKNRVSAAFGAVDPFNESRVLLPIDKMQAAKDKFLGPGTFGSGGSAQQAINEAQRIGTEVLPAIRPAAQGRQPQDLAQAVRALGGINPNSAGGMNKEIAELTRRQTGTTGLVSQKGRTIDQVAELMHERGFLETPDPAELLNALRGNVAGRKVYGADVVEDAFRGRLERSMGDAPQAGRMPKPITFDELQNLRSSIGEQWRAANRMGNAKEAAALNEQRRAIDAALDNLAAGKGQAGEFFAPDMVTNYKEARGLHAAKEQQFKTGPQAAIFRQGGDGLPMAQGAEIPGRFFNSKPSQIADAQSLRRFVAEDPALVKELRRYAVSDAAAAGSSRTGELTNASFNRWLERRSGAIGQTFNEQQRAWLKAIAEDLRRADMAESLGRSSGSDTAQKAASMVRHGFMDSFPGRALTRSIPGGGLLGEALAGPARMARAERFAGLLNDPERMGGLLDVFIATQQPRPTGLLGQTANPLLYRGAPLLLPGAGQ